MSFTPIDLSSLPAPSVVEALDYQTILSAMVADLQARDPEFTALVESDPAWKILEVAAYREMLVRQRVNDAARGVMLAYATGNDLEQLAGLFGVTRKTLTPADTSTTPPTPAVMESDADLRFRTTLALEGLSTAGPEGAYLYHSLSVNGVKGVSVVGPPTVAAGNVLVTVLSTTGNGTATTDLVNSVKAKLSDEDIRPLTDAVTVQSASVQTYTIAASIFTYPGPDYSLVLDAARVSAQAYADARHKLGQDITLSGLYAALHVSGVQKVTLTSPSADIVCDYSQAAYCTGISLTFGGTNE